MYPSRTEPMPTSPDLPGVHISLTWTWYRTTMLPISRAEMSESVCTDKRKQGQSQVGNLEAERKMALCKVPQWPLAGM